MKFKVRERILIPPLGGSCKEFKPSWERLTASKAQEKVRFGHVLIDNNGKYLFLFTHPINIAQRVWH